MKKERERAEQASERRERGACLKRTPESRPTDLTENSTPHDRKRHSFVFLRVSILSNLLNSCPSCAAFSRLFLARKGCKLQLVWWEFVDQGAHGQLSNSSDRFEQWRT
jgi:hypothetical protein